MIFPKKHKRPVIIIREPIVKVSVIYYFTNFLKLAAITNNL